MCEKRKTRAEQLFLAYFDNDVRDFILMPNIFLPHFRLSTRVPFEEEEVFNARIIFLLFFFLKIGKLNINIFFFSNLFSKMLISNSINPINYAMKSFISSYFFIK